MTMALQVARAWASALVHAGVGRVVVSPGARSGPLAVAAATEPGLEVSVHADERVASFLALGLARGSGRPVAFVCTSGSAGGHALPAVVEASATATPLLICTADRPAELHACGAAQVMPQEGLFRTFVVGEASVPVLGDESRWAALVSTTVARLVERARSEWGGPVHLNLALPEPLLPTPDAWSEPSTHGIPPWRPGGAHSPPVVVEAASFPWWPAWLRARRRVIVAGAHRNDAEAARLLLKAARVWDAVVIADPASGLREAATTSDVVVTSAHALLSHAEIAEHLKPDMVVRVGGVPVSRAITQWMSHPDITTVVVASARDIPDPHRTADWVLRGSVAGVSQALAACENPSPDQGWVEDWTEYERLAREALVSNLLRDEPMEALAVDHVWRMLPQDAHLQVASSMPIRWLDLVAGVRHAPGGTVACSRGVNGIDGTLATAWGEAVGRGARSAWCLLGDLALLHDMGSLLLHRAMPIPMRAVVLQNDGGGIFHHLPFAGDSEVFESVFGTPHGQRAAPIAEAMGWDVFTVTEPAELVGALEAASMSAGSSLVEVVACRQQSVGAWSSLLREVGEAVTHLRVSS